MPNESFDGVILGGLYFKEKENDKEKKSAKEVQVKRYEIK